MFELLPHWFVLMVNVSLKVLLLAGVTGLLLIASRVRDSSLKHAAWLGVLFSLIGIPLLSPVIPTIPIPWSFPKALLTSKPADPSAPALMESAPPLAQPAAIGEVNMTQREESLREQTHLNPDHLIPPEKLPASMTASFPESRTVPNVEISAESIPEKPARPTFRGFGWLPAVAMVWGVGTLILLVRLLLSIRITQRLVQRSTLLKETELPTNATSSIFDRQQSPVAVRVSPLIFVPLTTGWWRPSILLPTTWPTWAEVKLGHVLVHEFTHIRRGDCWTALVGELVVCVYWFHPLTWWLKRRLAVLAEECCDDAAIGITGNRAAYARHLLEIASVLCEQPRRVNYAGLAMTRCPQVERRILAILNPNRPLSQRLTWWSMLLLTITTVPLMTVAAALKPAEKTETITTENKPVATAKSDAMPVQQQAADPTASEKSKTSEIRVRGHITGDSGQPVAGAFVAVIAERITNDRGYVRASLAEGITDPNGNYELSVRNVIPQAFAEPKLVVNANGQALAWKSLDLNQPESQLDLQLRPEQVIQVRLIDIQGQPATGVSVEYRGIAPVEGKGEGLAYWQRSDVKSNGKAALPKLISDIHGLLSITHVPANYGVYLQVVGDEKLAPQSISLNTRWPETRQPGDGTYRGIIKKMKPGEITTLPLAPARIFEGVVWLGNTNKPAAHAKIKMWASDQDPVGSMVSVEGKTDANGRFRLNPYPGVWFGIIAYPPQESPFQIRHLGDLKWETGDAPRKLEIRLPMGVLVKGSVIDAESGRPLAKASVQYYPNTAKKKNSSSEIVTGWQGLQLTDEAGQFQIPVAPGSGTLLVHAPTGTSYVLRQKGSREIGRDLPGGTRYYAHAFQPINPTDPTERPDESNRNDTPDLNIKLQPTGTVTAKLIDTEGKPIQDAIFTSRLQILPTDPAWRAYSEVAKNGQAVIRSLEPGAKCPVFFLDVKRQLGATAVLSLDDPNPTVVLQPCASAKARFIDPSGKPVKKRFLLTMVVTPQEASFLPRPFADLRPDLLRPDEDYAVNFDNTSAGSNETTDPNGVMQFPLLVPGATYHFHNHSKDTREKEFVAKSGELHDLGDIVIQTSK